MFTSKSCFSPPAGIAGCGLLLLVLLTLAQTAFTQEPTYHGQIVRLMQSKCIKCHHAGGIGAGNWADYNDVFRNRFGISAFVGERIMPPWNAAPENKQGFEASQGFLPNNELTQEQIDLLVNWIDNDAPEGDPADAPPPLIFNDDWFQGEPDIVLAMPVEWEHPPGPDRYRCFPMETETGADVRQDEIIIGFEVKPSNLEIAHHAVIYIVDEAAALAMQAADTLTPGVPNDGWDCFGGVGIDGWVLQGWAPGANAIPILNENLGVFLPADKVLVNQMHYHNAGAELQFDRTEIGLRFSSDPNILLVNHTIPTQLPGYSTPAVEGPAASRDGGFGPQLQGEHNVYEMTIDINANSHLVSVFPHMHLIGSEFTVTATLPNRSILPIIIIDDWDFDWQLSYNFKYPIALAAGSTLNVRGTYFNNTSAPVYGGLFSNEEMLTLATSLTFDAEGIPEPRDSIPPRLIDFDVAAGSTFTLITVTFDEEIAEPHFPSAIDLTGPTGRLAAPDSIEVSGNILRIAYDMPLGDDPAIIYDLHLRGFFGIRDLTGNFFDGNGNGVGSELDDDRIIAFTLSDADLGGIDEVVGSLRMDDGAEIEFTVRHPGSAPPAGGWPGLIAVHGLGGSMNSAGPLGVVDVATDFAFDGFVTLTYSVRGQGNSTVGSGGSATPRQLLDLSAMKVWLEENYYVDPARVGITGHSQGGIHSWSAGILDLGFAVAVPHAWSPRNLTQGWVSNGSISRQGARFADSLGFSGFLLDYNTEGVLSALEAIVDDAQQGRSVGDITIPVLTEYLHFDSHGNGGLALQDYLDLVNAEDRMVYLGFGGHGTPLSDTSYVLDLRDRWLKSWLRGDANGILDEPPIHVALHSGTNSNEHLTFEDWPPPNLAEVTFYLREGNALTTLTPSANEAADTFANEVQGDVSLGEAFELVSNLSSMRVALPQDTILYTTDPLESELLVVGFPRVQLYVAGSASRYQVNVHLTDEDPGTGKSLLLAYGTYMVGTANATLDFDLAFTGRRIPAGHRIGLTITNLDVQETDPIGRSVSIRYVPVFLDSANEVFHDASRPSSLTIPVLAGGNQFEGEGEGGVEGEGGGEGEAEGEGEVEGAVEGEAAPIVFSVEPDNHDFGEIPAGLTRDATFTIFNPSDTTLSGTVVGDGVFTPIFGMNYEIPPGETHEVFIRFAPSQVHDYFGFLTFTGAGGEPVTRLVTGVGTEPPEEIAEGEGEAAAPSEGDGEGSGNTDGEAPDEGDGEADGEGAIVSPSCSPRNGSGSRPGIPVADAILLLAAAAGLLHHGRFRARRAHN